MAPLNFSGKWVLVTGASSGLGFELARQLAYGHGANIVALARRQTLLDELKDELTSKAHVQVLTIVADLSDTAQIDRAFREATEGREIYAAILNAGVTHFGRHSELEWDSFERMLNTNVVGVVRLTNAFVKYFMHQQGTGGLMIVASMAGIVPVPYQSAYSATKAFLVSFGRCLSQEFNSEKFSITVFAPGGIVTEMTSTAAFAPLKGWLMPVERVAREGLTAFKARRAIFVPGFFNRLGLLFMRLLPAQFVISRLAATYLRALRAVSLKH